VKTEAAVPLAGERPTFRRFGAGKTQLVFKWRYAVLGWLTWVVGKRVLRRKLPTIRH
jgi:hypothetical protein